MDHRIVLCLLLATAASSGACAAGTDDDLPDVRPETTDDAGADADADGDEDASADADADGDEDASADADADGDEDAGAGADADADGDDGADAEADARTCTTIAALRGLPDGAVDALLCEVRVTYVFARGYFVQEGPTGPAIEVFEGTAWTPDVAVGDEVTLVATSLTTFHGTREIDRHEPARIVRSGSDVAGWVQPVAAGSVPAEDREGELMRATDATVTAVSGLDVVIDAGGAAGVALRVVDASALCVGATLDVLAPVTEWDGTYRLQAFRAEDVTGVDDTGCAGGGRAPVAGDLRLNEFLADPPAGLAGDANCDGVRDGSSQQDEFVELVNVSAERLSLAGVTISDGFGVRHEFGRSVSLDPGRVVVVFGGGTPSCTWPADVQVFMATDGALGLNNAGDTITVALGAGTTAIVLQSYAFGAEGGADTSLTLNPDLQDTDPTPAGVAGFVAHTTADTADASPFSPGTRIDGTAF